MLLVVTTLSEDIELYTGKLRDVISELGFDLSNLLFLNFSSDTDISHISQTVTSFCKEKRVTVILVSGVLAFRALTGEYSLDDARFKKYDFNGIPVFSCFNPVYLNKGAKSQVSKNDKISQWRYDIQQALLCFETGFMREGPHRFNTYKIIETESDIDYLIAFCNETKICSFDIETTGLNPFNGDKILTLSISPQQGCSFVLPIHPDFSIYKTTYESSLDETTIKRCLQKLSDFVFDNGSIEKFGWNVKFDMRFLHCAGVRFSGMIHDGMVITHLLDENMPERGLKYISSLLFPITKGYGLTINTPKWYCDYTLEEIAEYNALDTDLALRSCLHYLSILLHDTRLYRHYYYIDLPVLKILCEMECNGMYVDRDQLLINIKKCEEMINNLNSILLNYPQVKRYETIKRNQAVEREEGQIREKIATSTGSRASYWRKKLEMLKTGVLQVYDGINFSSPKQLSEILFSVDGFNFPVPEILGSDTVSTADNVLNEINDPTGFIQNLKKLRKVEKIYSSFLLAFMERIDANSYIHPTFLQTGTVTGRLACKDPNLQQIPRTSSDISVLVKQVFTAPPGYKIIQVDLSQAELRIAAKLSGDPTMINAYANKLDLHTITAQKTLGISPTAWEKLDKQEKKIKRTAAKAINFGFLYGMQSTSFKQYAKDNYGVVLTESQAQEVRDAFFKTYHQLKVWHNVYKRRAKDYGYVETLFGRKRRLPDIHSNESGKVLSAERQAINAPVQGTAGEYTLFGLVKLYELLDRNTVKFVNTVHDSIILYVKEQFVDQTARLIKDIMENLPVYEYFHFTLLPIGMTVDIEVGDNWSNLQEFNI